MMIDTKEHILQTALSLFAKNGYAATSLSSIAGELGMTKGALYRHYSNKQDIFDSIVERMFQLDAERAKEHQVPEETFDEEPEGYRDVSIESVKTFIGSQFAFWTENEFGRNFRRLLTLEQYRDPHMADLYQKCFARGPMDYMEDVFRQMIEEGTLPGTDPQRLALDFFAPFHLLMSVFDGSPKHAEASQLYAQHVTSFFERICPTSPLQAKPKNSKR